MTATVGIAEDRARNAARAAMRATLDRGEALTTTASTINAAHEAAQAAAHNAVAHAIKCGEHLLAVKRELGHGEFMPWLAANVTFSERTAQGYMRLAQLDDEKRNAVADLTLRKALECIRTMSTTASTKSSEAKTEVRESSPEPSEPTAQPARADAPPEPSSRAADDGAQCDFAPTQAQQSAAPSPEERDQEAQRDWNEAQREIETLPTGTARERAKRAVERVKEAMGRSFHAQVEIEVRKRIQGDIQRLRFCWEIEQANEAKKLEQEARKLDGTAMLELQVSQKQVQTLLRLLHPDRHPDGDEERHQREDPERYHKAFVFWSKAADIARQNEVRRRRAIAPLRPNHE
jgi:hypothetical protein